MFHTLFCLFIKPELHKGQKVIGVSVIISYIINIFVFDLKIHFKFVNLITVFLLIDAPGANAFLK